MGNLLQYTDKSTAIDNKLIALLNQIKKDYDNGEIRTETEYYYRVKTAISNFYKSINKPMFVYRPAVNTPISSDYNAMIEESINDMQYIVSDCLSLSSSVTQSYIDADLNRTMMTNTINHIQKKVERIVDSIFSNKTANSVIFTELFNSGEEKKASYKTINASVDSMNGILTLGYTNAVVGKVTDVTIDTSISNGFPGNTHCVDILSNEVHYLGQNDLHNDLSKLCDNNTDTWFEYELINIPEETKQSCGYYGFEYDEGISWEGDGPLRLSLTLTLNTSSPCSWINLTPYLSDIKGVKACIIEKCEVVTNDNNVYLVAKDKPFDENCVITFPSKPVDKIVLTLVQPAWYPVKIGHNYYTQINTKSMSIFENYNTNESLTRVDGKNPSVSFLGAIYDPSTKNIEYPSISETKLSPSYVKNALFSMPNSTIDKQGGQEILDGYRYMIGIRDISVNCYEFKEEGVFVSQVYTTDKEINSVILESEEYIPGNNPEIIEYSISFDAGTNWHKIYPTHRAYTGVYRYTINNDNIENLLTTNNENAKSKNLNMLQNVYQVQLRIQLKRASDSKIDSENGVDNPTYTTPIVYSYKLIVNTGGEVIEY